MLCVLQPCLPLCELRLRDWKALVCLLLKAVAKNRISPNYRIRRFARITWRSNRGRTSFPVDEFRIALTFPHSRIHTVLPDQKPAVFRGVQEWVEAKQNPATRSILLKRFTRPQTLHGASSRSEGLDERVRSFVKYVL